MHDSDSEADDDILILKATNYGFTKINHRKRKVARYWAVDAYPETKKLFKQELDALQSLKHPNIGEMFEANPYQNGYAVLHLKYISCLSLQTIIFDAHFLYSGHTMIYWLIDLLNGVMFLHANRFLHRDLKPSNILLDDAGHLKIIDFETATTNLDPVETLTFTFGTHQYRPPESFHKNGQRIRFGVKGDTYAIGIIVWEMIRRMPLSLSWADDPMPKFYQRYLWGGIENCCEEFAEIVRTLTMHSPEMRGNLVDVLAHVHTLRNNRLFEQYEKEVRSIESTTRSIPYPPEGIGMHIEIEESVDPPSICVTFDSQMRQTEAIPHSVIMDHMAEARRVIRELEGKLQQEYKQREHTASSIEQACLYLVEVKNQLQFRELYQSESGIKQIDPTNKSSDMSLAEWVELRKSRPQRRIASPSHSHLPNRFQ